MLTLLESTAVEPLAAHFCRSVQTAPGGIFADHRLIIPSMTIRDWLFNLTADRLGICARLTPVFWGEFAWKLTEEITGDAEPGGYAPLSATAIQWQLFADFCQYGTSGANNTPDDPVQALLRAVPAHYDEPLKAYRLIAERLSAIYIRYLSLRPDWLWRWSTEDAPESVALLLNGESWQRLPDWIRLHSETIARAQYLLWQKHFAGAYLRRCLRLEMFWRILERRFPPQQQYPYYSRRLTDRDIAALCRRPGLEDFFRQLQNHAAHRPVRLPDKIRVYGIEHVSKDQWDFLSDLGRFCDIDVYHHHISDGYYGDMQDEKWLQRLQAHGQDNHADSVHPLLSRLGKQQKSTFRLLEDSEQFAQTQELPFIRRQTLPDAPRPGVTLLEKLQQELHELNPALIAAAPADTADESLRVHACHGLMRQLEILRGEIAHALNQNPELQLSDILIVMPDVSQYQALIRAVFPPGGQYDGFSLPAKITGITPTAAQNLWQALAGSYRLIAGTFDSESVTDWLLSDDVCAMLGVEYEAMERICQALLRAGFRRGFAENPVTAVDGDHRFTFCYALDRLCAGLLLPDVPCYADKTVPEPGIALEDAPAVNALCRLANRWRNREQDKVLPVRDWLKQLHQRLVSDFAAAAGSEAYLTVEKTLLDTDAQLAALSQNSEITAPAVALDFVLEDIGERLAEQQSSSEPSGVITIGRLGAMRGLPYKLIALLNMNIDDFPGNRQDDRYDLIQADAPRPGDRKREHEDLGAMLEAINNAGQRLLIFYNRYRDDGEEQLPAAPVQELLHYLNEQNGYSEENSPLHILHQSDPFHPDQSRSHAAPLWHKVAGVLAQEHQRPAPYLRPQLPEALPPLPATESQNLRTLSFNALAYALQHPAEHYARQTDIANPADNPAPEFLEPLHLNPLAAYQLNQYLITREQRQQSFDPLPYLPLLPVGTAGEITLQQAQETIARQKQTLLPEGGELTSVREQMITVAGLRIQIALPEQTTGTWLQLHPGKSKARHLLRLWLAHLCRHSSGQSGDSLCAFQDSIIRLPAVSRTQADALLKPWLQLYFYSGTALWLLPPEIGYDLSKQPQNSDSRIIEQWLQRLQEPQYRSDRLWRLFLRDLPDPPGLIRKYAESYVDLLYAPIRKHLERRAG